MVCLTNIDLLCPAAVPLSVCCQWLARPGKSHLTKNILIRIRDNYVVGREGWMAKADIFEDYIRDCDVSGTSPMLTAPAFGRLVHKAFPGVKSCRMGPRVHARYEPSSSSSSSPASSFSCPDPESSSPSVRHSDEACW